MFFKAINNLKEQQWADIIKAALTFSISSKQQKAAKVIEVLSETDSDEEDELVDPRYKDIPAIDVAE